jgi:hypothetical protein
MVMTTRRLTCGFAFRFDSHDKLLASPGGQSPRGKAEFLRGALFIGFVAAFILLSCASPSYAWKNHEMNLKLYAHNQISDWDQFICFIDLIEVESSWNYKAKNGSHYGLGQMKSTWYKDLTPRQQIKAHLRYIDHRYDGKPCKAYKHWTKYGWH